MAPDTVLQLAGGRELMASSATLMCASTRLHQSLREQKDAGPACGCSKHSLSLPDDSAEGWAQVLDLIDPGKPEVPTTELTLVSVVGGGGGTGACTEYAECLQR
jgi:hypothetical protein